VRKQYSCDFETTTDPNDCRVWAYGYMEIGNKTNYKIGNSLEDFMFWAERTQADLYFHNLRFDGEFIVNWLLHNGYKHTEERIDEPMTFSTIISKMGQWYQIDICYGRKKKKLLHTKIQDSLKKLPFSVKNVAKGFKLDLEKGDIDYHAFRPVGHVITDEEYKYIKNDIEIVADALEIQFKQGLKAMTNGSDSFNDFKATISTKLYEKFFPVMSLEADNEIRFAYRGGFTWLNDRFKNQEVEEGIVFDVNSLYPSVMYEKDLPYGLPIPYDGEYVYDEDYPLYIQHIRCEFVVKKGKIPTIQIKKLPRLFKGNEYLKSSDGEIVDLYVTNVDLEIIKEHYNLYYLEYVGGSKFRKKVGIFNKFIDKWTLVKTTNTGAKQLLAKLMLNSLYGKFATNPDVTGKVPFLREDGSCGSVEGEEDFKDPKYTPMGVFITSWARWITITTAQKCYDRIIYCDTDSIHLTGREIPKTIAHLVDPKKLGYWKYEYTFKRAKYIRQKTYLNEIYVKEVVEVEDGEEVVKLKPCVPEESTTTKITVKCAGMPEEVKKYVTWENFRVGFTSKKGKKKPLHVKGGIVLVDTPFTLKEHAGIFG
jgi:hypothetical protein